VAEALELGDEALGGLLRVAAGEVVAAEVGVDLAGGQHVPAGDDDRVLDGAERLLVPAARAQAGVLGGEVGVLGARRGQGGLFERPIQPLGEPGWVWRRS